MKALLLVGLLFAIGQSVDVWTPFLDEEGFEYDVQVDGLEFSKFGSTKGGNGGGAWLDDCEKRGGINKIQMQCGRFVGSFRLQCKNKQWMGKRGKGWGNGKGKVQSINGQGITKVVINAGKYVDRVRFFKGKKQIKLCGKSGGGKAYTATAPKGMTLCGLKGRAGWWMDSLAAGWCKKPKPKKRKCLPCAQEFKKAGGCKLMKENSPLTQSKIPKGCMHCGKVAKKICGIGQKPKPCTGALCPSPSTPSPPSTGKKCTGPLCPTTPQKTEKPKPKRKCLPCAQEFKKAGGCDLWKKKSPLTESKIPKGCGHCAKTAAKVCAEKRKCLPCAQEFKKAGGCELWKKNSPQTKTKIPKGCGHCAQTAKKVCFGGSKYGTAEMFEQDEEIIDTVETEDFEEFPQQEEEEIAQDDEYFEDEQMFDEDQIEADFAQDSEEEQSSNYGGVIYTALGVICVGGAVYMFTRRSGKSEYEVIPDEE